MTTSVTNPNRQTKTATLTRLLSRKAGADLAALQKVTGWQAHSVRAALSGLRKSGYIIERLPPKTEGASPAYKITATPEAR